MAEISIGAAVGEGFALIRGRPLVVLAWGLTQIAFTGLTFLLFSSMLPATIGAMVHQAQNGGAPSPADLQNMMRLQPISQLLNLIGLLVSAVLNCAVFRAVLHPEQRRFAYLRVGAPELFLVALLFAGVIALVVAVFIAVLVIGLIAAILVAVHANILAVIFGILGGFGIVVALIYCALRLSLVGPMMVDDGKFHLFDAWALTRGKALSLLAVAFLTVVILIVVELVLGLIVVAVGIGTLGAAAGGLGNLPIFFQQSPQLIIGKLAPLLIVVAVLWAPVFGCMVAILGAPYARVYRDLMPAGDVSETFA